MRRLARDTVSERDRTVTSVYDQWAAIVKPAHHLYIEPTKRHAHLVVPSTRVHADPTHLHHRQSLAVTLMTLNKEPTRAARVGPESEGSQEEVLSELPSLLLLQAYVRQWATGSTRSSPQTLRPAT